MKIHPHLTRKIFLLSIAAFILLFACQKKSIHHKFLKFDHEFSLKAKQVAIDEVYTHGRFSFYDTLLIITNTPGNEHQIHIYNKNFKYITSSGKSGKGPGEIANPFFASLDSKHGIVWFLDMGKRNIFKFPVDSMLKNPQFLSAEKESMPVPSAIPILLQYYPYGDDLFSCANYFSDKYLISFFNKNGEVIDSLGITKSELLDNINSSDKRIPKVTFLYEKHPKKELYALVYKYSDIVVIINNKGEVISISQGPDMINQNPDALIGNHRIAYAEIHCDEHHIYALYNGNYVTDENQHPNYPQIIHVFDWDGKPVAKLDLDHPIVLFTLQNDVKRAVAFSQSSGEIVYYDFPSQLR